MNDIYVSIKILWASLILSALAWYISTTTDVFLRYANEVELINIVLSVVFIVFSKVVLSIIAVESIKRFSGDLTFFAVFCIYSISQVGKYLPGSVWQYVGRIGLYKAEGLEAKLGTKALVVECFWLLSTGFFFGIVLCFERLLYLSGIEVTEIPSWLKWILIGGGLALWLLVLFWGTRVLVGRFGGENRPELPIFILELFAWAGLGLSLWVLFPVEYQILDTMILACGAFALGWVGGYVSPFAPAGIGVREAIIVALVADTTTIPVALVTVTANRILYSFVDLGLGAVAGIWYRPGPVKTS